MRTVPIHWLLLVCFLATPLSHGQATAAAPMTAHEIANAFANWTGTPQLLRQKQARQHTEAHQAFPPTQRRAIVITPALPETTNLPPRPSETPTAQPAGP